MGRPPRIPVEKKMRIVPNVLAGEVSIAGEAAVEIRVWNRSAEGRLTPLRTLR